MYIVWSDPLTWAVLGWVTLMLLNPLMGIIPALRRHGRARALLGFGSVAVTFVFYFYVAKKARNGELGDIVFRKAPEVSLTTAEGKPLSLHDLNGKVVLMNFWSTRCGACDVSRRAVAKLRSEFPADQVVIVSVNSGDGDAAWRASLSRDPVGDYQCRDTGGAEMTLGGEDVPFFALITRDGHVRYLQRGWTPITFLFLEDKIKRAMENRPMGEKE